MVSNLFLGTIDFFGSHFVLWEASSLSYIFSIFFFFLASILFFRKHLLQKEKEENKKIFNKNIYIYYYFFTLLLHRLVTKAVLNTTIFPVQRPGEIGWKTHPAGRFFSILSHQTNFGWAITITMTLGKDIWFHHFGSEKWAKIGIWSQLSVNYAQTILNLVSAF